MAWDDKAYAVTIKAIGTVESNMKYDAINYNDPITVGVAQWYGTRAAGLLHRIKDENPDSWKGVTDGFNVVMLAWARFDPRWNLFYLPEADGESLKPVLAANREIQNEQFAEDLEEYIRVAKAWGMEPDTNLKGTAFFCTMYHQAPARTQEILIALDANPSIDELLQAALNNPILGQYPERQHTAYEIINAWDSTGVDYGDNDPGEPEPNPGVPDPGYDVDVPGGSLKRVSVTGDSLVAYFSGGLKVMAHPDGKGQWIAKKNEIGGGSVHVPGTPDPDDPDEPSDPIEPGTWVSPVSNNRCTNRFGALSYTKFHSGIDLGARSPGVAGDTIRAINNGRVVTRGRHGEVLYLNSGRGLMLDHGEHDGVRVHSYYGHLSDWLVEEGDEVTSGQPIAKMGGTGANDSNSDFAVHLHLVIILDGTITEGGVTKTAESSFTDPEEFLRARGVFDGMAACPYN